MKNPHPDLDVLISATFYLMSRFAKSQDAGLIEAVKMHFQLILNHPDSKSEVINKVCKQLENYWNSIGDDINLDNNNSTCSDSGEHNIFNIH